MSSLLQRMVQGIRAPQQRIEPLLPPRYAGHERGGLGSQARQRDGMKPFREENQPSLAESHSAKSPGPFEFRSPVNRRDVPEKQGAAMGEDSTSEPAAVRGRTSSPEPSSHRSSSAGVPVTAQAERQDHGSYKTEAASLTTPQPPKSARPSAASASANLSGMPRQTSPVLERTSGSNLRDSKKPGTEQMAVTRRAQAEPLTLRRPEDQPTMRHSDRVPFAARAGAETTTTQVTISIGRVEIRAGQPAARPRRPAFRPRVSLSDFLNRREPERL